MSLARQHKKEISSGKKVVDLQAELKERKVQKFGVWEKLIAFIFQTVRV